MCHEGTRPIWSTLFQRPSSCAQAVVLARRRRTAVALDIARKAHKNGRLTRTEGPLAMVKDGIVAMEHGISRARVLIRRHSGNQTHKRKTG